MSKDKFSRFAHSILKEMKKLIANFVVEFPLQFRQN